MKKVTIIVVAILLVILVAVLKDSFSISIGPKSASTSTNTVDPTQNKNSGLETKESNEGPVVVTVIPRSLEEDLATWDFEVTLNTHSEELSADLVAISELVDDQGKSYNPISWEGSPPGGHHRSGILKFNPILPKPKSLELTIKNIGETAERSFKWDL